MTILQRQIITQQILNEISGNVPADGHAKDVEIINH